MENKDFDDSIPFEKEVYHSTDPRNTRYFPVKESEIRMIDGLSIEKVLRSYIVKIPTPIGEALFTFSQIIRSRQSFEVMLTTSLNHNTDGMLPTYDCRIDINSQSAVATLSTQLNKGLGKDSNWVLMLNKAGNALKKLINEEQRPLKASEELKPVEFLLFPFMQKGSSNMIFADSEVGKSFFGLYMASCAASGQKMLEYSTNITRTLYLDYEDDYDTFSYRLHSICNGNGLDFEKVRNEVQYYKPQGDMVDESEIIAKMVVEHGFDLIIIDAGSSATGGDPLNATPVIKLFDSLEHIPCTKLIIHHEGKATEGKTDGQSVYGTTFWKARIRVGWRLNSISERKAHGQTEKIIRGSMFKGSNLARQDSFIYKSIFSGTSITFSSETQYQDENEGKVFHVIAMNDGITIPKLVEITGIALVTMQRLLPTMQAKGMIVGEKKGRGATSPVIWVVKDGILEPQNESVAF
jgi:hypothetical protein